MSFLTELQKIDRVVNESQFIPGNPKAGILPRLEVGGKWAVKPAPGNPGFFIVGYITGASIDWSVFNYAQSYHEVIITLKEFVDSYILEGILNPLK